MHFNAGNIRNFLKRAKRLLALALACVMWQVKRQYLIIDEHAYFQLVFRMSAQEDAAEL